MAAVWDAERQAPVGHAVIGVHTETVVRSTAGALTTVGVAAQLGPGA